MVIKILLLIIGAVLAFWISTISGGGASLILIPILNVLLPVSVVPFSLTVGTCTSSISRIAIFKKHIDWKMVRWFVPFSLPAVLLGGYLIKYINPHYLQLLVALLLLSNIPQLLRRNKSAAASSERISPAMVAVIGFFAGFVSGITGAIGLLFNRFYLKGGLTKEAIIATRAANEVILHGLKLIIYCVLGLYSTTAWWLGLVIAMAALLATYSVKFILPYVSEVLFKRIGYAAMVIAGVFLLQGTTKKIIEHDKIAFSTVYNNNKKETVVSWRDTDFVMEYNFNDGLEVERPIPVSELPPQLQAIYKKLLEKFDIIYLEKVFAFGKPPAYEFYCYKNDVLTKLEY